MAGFLFLYYAWRRQWKVVITGLMALTILTYLTAGVLGAGCYRDYIRVVVPEIHWFRVGWNNASLMGFWSRLFDPALERIRNRSRSEPLLHSPAIARAGAWTSSLLVMGTLAWTTQQVSTRVERDLAFGLAVTAMLLISPISWDHYFVLLLVPLAVFWMRLPPSRLARGSFLVIVGAFWLLPAVVWTVSGIGGRVATPFESATVISYQMYALLSLFALGIAELRTACR